VIFSVAYQLTRCLLDCPMLLTRRETSRDAELLVLRHETRCCAARLAGSAISPPTGCGSRRCRA
jgi:putative transposase